jgi:hypothetical protein
MLTQEGMKPALATTYGSAQAANIVYAETFQYADNSRKLSPGELRNYFPMLPPQP